jgi:hypothetical protein
MYFGKKETRDKYSDGTVTITRFEIAGKFPPYCPVAEPIQATTTFPNQITA